MRALGEIGSAEAVRTLLRMEVPAGDRVPWEEAVVFGAGRCAVLDAPTAVSAFRRVSESVNVATRAAALVGLGRLGALPNDEWRSALLSPERLLREAAVALAATGVRDTFIPTAALMAELSAEVQLQLVVVLAARGASGALPAIRRALQAGEPQVRAAAARALGELGDTASAEALFALAFSDDEPGAGARAGLGRLPGRGIDERLMQRFAQSKGQPRAWAIEILTTRGYTPLAAALLDARLLETPVLLRATTEALRTLARVEDFGGLVAFTLSLSPDHRGSLAAVLGHIARRADHAAEILRTCDKELRAAAPATAATMLQLYAVVQTPEAAAALSSWLRHEARGVRLAAVQALGRWESGGSVEVLLEAAETHADPELRSAALRAVAGVLRRRNAFRDQAPVLVWLRRALTVAESVEDKKALLTTVAQYRGATARKLVEQYFDDPKLGAEAKNIAERMR